MKKIESIAVYCGSSKGFDAEYEKVAFQLGEVIAEKGIQVVFGGGHVGLMGAVANGALSKGGDVIGFIPDFLEDRELGHKAIKELHVVGSMHERKAKIEALSDAFIALPGGFGTLEEITEMMTWFQLGLHKNPIGILNTLGFYDKLLEFFDQMASAGFLQSKHLEQFIIEQDPRELISKLLNHTPDWELKLPDLESQP